MSLETLPVVHLDEGRFPEYPDQDIERVLTTLARRFGRVVLVDVAGVRKNDADLEFLSHAARRRAIWADAGSRYATDAMDLFVAGAESVTLRWNTLDAPEELEEAAEVCDPGTLFLALELRDGAFLRHPHDKRDLQDVARYAETHGVGVVYQLDRAERATLDALPITATPRYLHAPLTVEVAEALGMRGLLLAPSLLPQETPP